MVYRTGCRISGIGWNPYSIFNAKKDKFAPNMWLANFMCISIYGYGFHIKSIKRGPRGREFGAIYGRISERKNAQETP